MDDHEILKVLREARSPGVAAVDADPPARVLEAAYAAGDWLRLDDELAELVADSADALLRPGVRAGSGGTRQLTYRRDDLSLECEVAADSLLGQVAPPAGVRLELVSPDGSSRPVDLDEDGRFLVRPRPRGALGIRCIRPGRPGVLTPWLLA